MPRPCVDTPTRETLTALDVTIVEFDAPHDIEHSHANKLGALRVPSTADRLVMLDTDIIALAPFRDQPMFDSDVVAKPADLQTWTHDLDVWRRTFRLCGRELPFGDQWQDMPALAAALAMPGVSVAPCFEEFNFPAHLRPVSAAHIPTFAHYHWSQVVCADTVLRTAIRDYARDDSIGAVLQADATWAQVRTPPTHLAAIVPPDCRGRHALIRHVDADARAQHRRILGGRSFRRIQ